MSIFNYLEPEPAEEYTEQSEVESTEVWFLFNASFPFLPFKQFSNIYFALQYVNRQFMAETQFSSGEKEQVDEWTVETVEVRVLSVAKLMSFVLISHFYLS